MTCWKLHLRCHVQCEIHIFLDIQDHHRFLFWDETVQHWRQLLQLFRVITPRWFSGKWKFAYNRKILKATYIPFGLLNLVDPKLVDDVPWYTRNCGFAAKHFETSAPISEAPDAELSTCLVAGSISLSLGNTLRRYRIGCWSTPSMTQGSDLSRLRDLENRFGNIRRSVVVKGSETRRDSASASDPTVTNQEKNKEYRHQECVERRWNNFEGVDIMPSVGQLLRHFVTQGLRPCSDAEHWRACDQYVVATSEATFEK